MTNTKTDIETNTKINTETNAETDPGEIGETIARLEMILIALVNHPDPYVKNRVSSYLKRVEAMKQELQDGIQHVADTQAGDNLD